MQSKDCVFPISQHSNSKTSNEQFRPIPVHNFSKPIVPLFRPPALTNMPIWSVLIKTAIVTIGIICTVIRLNSMYNSSSNANESNRALCEVCKIPQMDGDATTWTQLNCGHCYHKNCLSMIAFAGCFSCELRETEKQVKTN
ncbi:uncharacterized protein LOC128717932 [Anopheles marshallii]|uniref:uncharacterized protein LOC128717932 n=1 Tax=Anopheles marshallii TaxID=1521116 RepID=UPI00237B9A31|nr:uncharacterized protein LOC128717932 [Anopheles marshallii]